MEFEVLRLRDRGYETADVRFRVFGGHTVGHVAKDRLGPSQILESNGVTDLLAVKGPASASSA